MTEVVKKTCQAVFQVFLIAIYLFIYEIRGINYVG